MPEDKKSGTSNRRLESAPLSDPEILEIRRFCTSGCDIADAAEFVRGFANDKRLLILHELACADELSVGELAHAVRFDGATLSQHLKKLRTARFIHARRDGKRIYYRLSHDVSVQNAIRSIDLLLR
jgi:DNA-binding transcriptional ArsR family regulator